MEQGGRWRTGLARLSRYVKESIRENYRNFDSLQTLQEMWNCKYIETSAKTGKNVDELFEQLLKMERTVSLTLQQPEERKRAGRRCAIV